MPGFFPDPTICRVGVDYFLAHSSFEYFPGSPVFHSQDLVSWTQIGNILTRRSQFRRGDPRPSTGIYGSTLRCRDGRFWLVTTNVSAFESGQLVVHADDPAGPWSEPTYISGAVGIDPDLCWDEDGQCYLSWKAMSATFEDIGIRQARVDLATGALAETPYAIWQGTGLAAAEAPHLYHIGDYWYLLLAEGGTERGHCVTAARGRSPKGPFEPCPSNPIFTRRSTAHPVQNVGHTDLVQMVDGDWGAVYLGVRPRGSTPGFHVLGRETFLAGVEWIDGWPAFQPDRFEVPTPDTGFADDFSATRLDPRWVVPGGEPDAIATPHALGGLELRPTSNGTSGLLCTRVRDLVWTAEAVFEGAGRFLLRLDDRHWCGLTIQDGEVTATAQVGAIRQQLNARAVATDSVVLRISAGPPPSPPVPRGIAGPDELVLSILESDRSVELARLDGRYISTEVASGFTGRMLAVGAAGSPAHLLSVTYAHQSS